MENNIDINNELDKLKENHIANLIIGNLISNSDNNIDKDIKNIKSFISSIRSDLEDEAEDNYKLANSISNVLSELEKKNIRIKNLKEENELQHCDLQNSYSINNGLKKELETWKKIAEKIAMNTNDLSFMADFCREENRFNKCVKNEINCVDCIIDWVRKEVEKSEL